MKQPARMTESLCLACGLCCNGALFADVILRGASERALFEDIGCVLRTQGGGKRLPQPCPAWIQSRCQIYDRRPLYCREFDCQLLLDCRNGQMTSKRALSLIRRAARQLGAVERCFQQLNDRSTHLCLRLRFQRLRTRLARRHLSPAESLIFSRLGLRIHQLNLLLSKYFLPSSPPHESPRKTNILTAHPSVT
ncbi:MAG TPA: hypothetical protein P5186_07645 [Candidatus Paceibacterota bacterium]|nr:hypothetical protein [Candidatus Paceibacterota bacterium]HSA02916.1 hypothetical protein [Candidatus Paceibacterota bacterium]